MIKFTVNTAKKTGKNIHMVVHESSEISNGGHSYVSSVYISVDVNEPDVKLQR